MKNLNKYLHVFILKFLIYLISLTILSCEKNDVPKEIPNCIKDKIKEGENNCLETVFEYDYNGKKVYLFNYPCPEGCQLLLDEKCVNTNVCTCTFGGTFCDNDFLTHKSNEKLIWKK